ncbi:MAG: sensor histidine kinase, partial [Bacteroidia bacterium]
YEVSYEERLRTNSKDWYPVFWQGLSCLNQAEYLLEMGKYSTCEALADSGYQYVLLSERIVNEPKTASEAVFNALQVLIKIKLHFKKWEETKLLLEKASRIKAECDVFFFYNFNLRFYQNCVNYYEAQKDYTQAFQYQKLANEVKDSLNSQQDKRKLWQTEMQIETDKFQTSLQLAEKENKKQSQFTLWAVIALICVVISALWVYFRINKDNKTISAQRDLLAQSLKDKEMLLKEVHHRVKNNLQIIAGLLERQSQQATDEATRKNLKDGQDRVFSIALVHQNLYKSDNLSSLEIKTYLEMLVKNIKQAENNQAQAIEVHLDVDDAKLDIDNAIPIGLILNELITNCYKYAFQGREKGNIFIDFHKNQHKFQLSVKDDGVGISKGVNLQKTTSLGLHLVRGLTRQLGAVLTIDSNEQGTCFLIQSKA